MASKKKNVQKHFFRRSLERVGVLLDEKDLVKKIQNNELEFIERQSNRVTVFKFIYRDTPYRIIYDKQRKQIITILFERGEQCKTGK